MDWKNVYPKFNKNNLKLHKSRGISTIVGGLIFLVLMTSAFSTFYIAFDILKDTINTQREISKDIIQKTQEQFFISAATDPDNNHLLGIQVKNQGQNPVEISNIWIINKSATETPPYSAVSYDVNYDDAFISPGYGTPILEKTPLYLTPNDYTIKVISTLGSIKTADVVVGGPNNLLAEMFTIPPDVRQGENVTIALRVTNVGNTPLVDVEPHYIPPDVNEPSEIASSQFISPSPITLEPTESTIFTWHYKVKTNAVIGTKVKFTSAANATDSATGFDILSNNATGTIIIRDPKGGSGEEIILKDELFGKPQIFMIIPNAAGDDDDEFDRPIWGVNVANPTDQPMYVTKLVIIAISPRATSSDKIFVEKCEANIGKPEKPMTIAPTPDRWSCPESNQLMWLDLATPQLVEPRSVFPFLVKIGTGNMGSTLPDAQNILIQPIVFTTLGQFGKAGYGTTMHSSDVAIPNVYLSRVPESTSSADIMGEMRGIVEGTTVTFYATIADLTDDDTYGINAGTKLIINIPKQWTFVGPICPTCYNGFNLPTVVTYPDGSTQIVGELSSGIDKHDEAKTIKFTATAPSVLSAKMYVMHILADGTATGDSVSGVFTVGPIAESVLQVCPTSGCP